MMFLVAVVFPHQNNSLLFEHRERLGHRDLFAKVQIIHLLVCLFVTGAHDTSNNQYQRAEHFESFYHIGSLPEFRFV
jgi:hypothetical protein